jgi:hypothetical protein
MLLHDPPPLRSSGPRLRIKVERDGASHLLQPRRKLGDRIWHAYANAMIGLTKIIVGTVAGIMLARALVLLVAIVSL